jgi:hypothetical protein
VKWSHVSVDSILSQKQFERYPFFSNTQALYQAIRGDSNQLFVIPNVINSKNNNAKYARLTALHDSLSQVLCKRYDGVYIPFKFTDIKDSRSWIDDCHLDSKGECDKAKLIAKAILTQIDSAIFKLR